MNREEFLKTLIENRDGNVKSFSERIKVPYTTVRTILEKGVGNARVDNVIKICNGLNIKPEELNKNIEYSTFISDTVTNMTKLQPPLQEKVLNYAEEQLEEQNKNTSKVSSIEDYKIKYNNNLENEKIPFTRIGATGAGIGEELCDDVIKETVYFDKNEVDEELIETADFCVYVNGDSMEPAIKRDSYAFVRRINKIRNGLVALIIYDGTALIKKLDINDDSIDLISLNPKYETIKVEPHHQFKLIGKIVQ